MDWCSRHPSDFDRAVLINSSAAGLSPPWHRMAPATLVRLLSLALEKDATSRERTILEATTCLEGEALEARARTWAELAHARPISKKAILSQLAAASRFKAPASLPVRTLIIAGGCDRLVNPACQARLSSHFAAPLSSHPDAGHDLPLDQPEWLADQVSGL